MMVDGCGDVSERIHPVGAVMGLRTRQRKRTKTDEADWRNSVVVAWDVQLCTSGTLEGMQMGGFEGLLVVSHFARTSLVHRQNDSPIENVC